MAELPYNGDMDPLRFDLKTITETAILNKYLKDKKEKKKGEKLSKEEEKKTLATSFFLANMIDLF